jgi:proline dehydrogenase
MTASPATATEPRRSALRRMLGWVAGKSTVRKLAMSTPFVRDVAWRFVAGEDLPAGLATVRALNAEGITATLNHVGTHVTVAAEAVAAADEVIAALDGIHASGVDSHVSLKLTQIGLDVDRDLCRAQLWRVLDRARDTGIFVRIDMEESPYVGVTIELFEEARAAFGSERVGIVLQSYLRGHRDDVARLAAAGGRIRLVKGGYWESPDVVFQAKDEIDQAFLADIRTLMAGATDPAIATHDPVAIETARRAADAAGRDRSSFELQMLMGVRPDLQRRLVAEGFRVRCYVPYGGQWYTYVLGCLRRVPGGVVARLRERVRPGRTERATPAFGGPADGGPADGGPADGGPSRGIAADEGALPGMPVSRRALLGVKRAMDVAGAIVGLVVLSPVLAWTAVAVVATMGRPILFRQRRPGRGGRSFTIVKFRTMRPVPPGDTWFRTDAVRVTRLGQFLRTTSLDELPELWNVLRGDMSLVGPRPLLEEYLACYTPREFRRHEMRPGITGWAAISGRHMVPFEERLEMDVWYVDHWSLELDIRILGRTVGQVLGRRGVRVTQTFDDVVMPQRFLASIDASLVAPDGGSPARDTPDARPAPPVASKGPGAPVTPTDTLPDEGVAPGSIAQEAPSGSTGAR